MLFGKDTDLRNGVYTPGRVGCRLILNQHLLLKARGFSEYMMVSLQKIRVHTSLENHAQNLLANLKVGEIRT